MARTVMVRFWKLTLLVLLLSVLGIVYLGYFCHGRNCALRGNAVTYKSNYEAYFAGRFLQNKFTEDELNKEYELDLGNEDIIVFLHIQKTGGTSFGKHLVENLDVNLPLCTCYKRTKKRCKCLSKEKHVWLFSRYTTGWQCGLHADWTELKTCVDQWFHDNYGQKKRRYYYISLLRDPVSRFISEWIHVQRGATWKTSTLKCNGRGPTLEEVPFCFTAEDWSDVTLKEFLACKHNLAFNRQTRMLANLSKVNCYNTSIISTEERQRLMLESAKENLVNLAFFGLVEYQAYSQFLFEHMLNIRFVRDLVQLNVTHSSKSNLSQEELRQVAQVNQLDIELYLFAKDLFLQRVKQAYLDKNMTLPPDLLQLTSAKMVGGGKDFYMNLHKVSVQRSPQSGVLDEEDREPAVRHLVSSQGEGLVGHFTGQNFHSLGSDKVAERPESSNKNGRHSGRIKRKKKHSVSSVEIEQEPETERIPISVHKWS